MHLQDHQPPWPILIAFVSVFTIILPLYHVLRTYNYLVSPSPIHLIINIPVITKLHLQDHQPPWPILITFIPVFTIILALYCICKTYNCLVLPSPICLIINYPFSTMLHLQDHQPPQTILIAFVLVFIIIPRIL